MAFIYQPAVFREIANSMGLADKNLQDQLDSTIVGSGVSQLVSSRNRIAACIGDSTISSIDFDASTYDEAELIVLSWSGSSGTVELTLPDATATKNLNRVKRIISDSTFSNSTHADLTPVSGQTWSVCLPNVPSPPFSFIPLEEINSSKVTLSLAAAAFISATEDSYKPSADKYISSIFNLIIIYIFFIS